LFRPIWHAIEQQLDAAYSEALPPIALEQEEYRLEPEFC
jgi:hypothetical protein